ncbi:MAG: cell division protein SepF [Bifidobacteriaceae bacterium]|jgi:cell division inhibitor SepF|nr:cell division protein SepF [Bifidobacteriaceae bacterium]
MSWKSFIGLDEKTDDDDYYDEMDEDVEVAPRKQERHPSAVQPVKQLRPAIKKILTVQAEDVKEDMRRAGTAFRNGTPVILNLHALSDTEVQRALDFASGLQFGLRGTIKNVSPKVFLLMPQNMEVEDKEEVDIDARDSESIFD